MEQLEQARHGGSPEGTLELGKLKQHDGKLLQAVALFEEARTKGSAEAAYLLGLHFWDEGEVRKAKKCLEEAQDGGFAQATTSLAMLHVLHWDRLCASPGNEKWIERKKTKLFKRRPLP